MNVFALVLVAGSLSQAPAKADQAFLGIFAETTAMKIAGMPPLPPGMDFSKMPGGEAMADLFGGRKLTVRLWSPTIAPANATASIAPPAGLKQGPKLDLDIYRPKPGQTSDDTDDKDFPQDKMAKMTIRIYWGSSPTVKPGQPKIIKYGDLSPYQIEEMKKQQRQANRQSGTSYFYKPDWTTAYWPSKKQSGRIAKDASLVGTYTLTTNYCGNVSLDSRSDVEFLDPIDIVQPSFENKLNLGGALAFEWKPIPNLLGSYAMAMGFEGEDTMILWYSSEVYDQASMGLNWGYLQMAEVRDFVKKTIMMPGDCTTVTIPEGIFKDADYATMIMAGFGPGSALPEGQPLPRIQTKTNLTAVLGGKKVKMGGTEKQSSN